MYPNCRICFHLIDATVFDAFPIPKELEHVTQEMYYRYVLPDVLKDESRTIYSDVDVLCVGDVRALWELDLNGNILAAVSEGKAGEFKKKLLGLGGDAPYFYSGLLLMDLGAMRNGGFPAKLIENTLLYADKISWPDQDVINLTFFGKILQLEDRWDGINVRYSPFRRDVAIWHFPGFTLKPWCNIWKNTTWPIYLKYLLKSPYRNNALRFIWSHIKGFFFYTYTKKGVTRYLVCGVKIWKKRGRGQ
jgi:lipopolysaccharide biosynthesis glycosyltransferase